MENQSSAAGSSARTKRMRQSNYSTEEKSYLLQLVNKYKTVIENKKTDAINNVQKEEAWQKIATEFNAVAPNNIHRDAISLKKVYSNIKKNVRKEIAEEKVEIIKTGGGTYHQKRNPLQEMALDTMNPKTVFGLHNNFDNDNLLFASADKDSDLPMDLPEQEELIYNQGEDELENTHTWTKWNPQNLQQRLEKGLATKINSMHGQHTEGASVTEETSSSASKVNVKSRRRPGAVALNSSEIGNLYSKLCEKRLEVALLEKTILENRVLFEKGKHEVEIEILRAELKIKENILKKDN